MQEKYSDGKLQPMFGTLEELTENHQPLNKTLLNQITCATGICLGCGHSLKQLFCLLCIPPEITLLEMIHKENT